MVQVTTADPSRQGLLHQSAVVWGSAAALLIATLTVSAVISVTQGALLGVAVGLFSRRIRPSAVARAAFPNRAQRRCPGASLASPERLFC